MEGPTVAAIASRRPQGRLTDFCITAAGRAALKAGRRSKRPLSRQAGPEQVNATASESGRPSSRSRSAISGAVSPGGLSPCRGRRMAGRAALVAGRGAKTAGRSSGAGLAPTAFSSTPGLQIRPLFKVTRRRAHRAVGPISRQVGRFCVRRGGGRTPVSDARLRLAAFRENRMQGRLRGQRHEGGGLTAQLSNGEKTAGGRTPAFCTKDVASLPLSRVF